MTPLQLLLKKAVKNADGSLTVSRDLLKEVKATQAGEDQLQRRYAMRRKQEAAATAARRSDDE